MSIDFGKTASDYRTHRAGFPPEFFNELQKRDIGNSAQKILDLATGTGTVARGLAQKGAAVTAIDIAQPLLDQAQELDREAGISIDYHRCRAEALPFSDDAFDVVTAGQCWHWFSREQVAAESFRVLRAGGQLVIAHFDWLPIKDSVVAATESLILAHNPGWTLAGGTGMYPQWCEDLTLAGFDDIRTLSFDQAIPYSHERWRGRIRASAGVAASLPPPEVAAFDRELGQLLLRQFPQEPLLIPHRIWMLICRKPG